MDLSPYRSLGFSYILRMSSFYIPLQILVVEDNPGDYFLIQDYLKEKRAKIRLRRAITFEEAKQILKSSDHFDAVVLDLSLPDAHGESLVRDIIQLSGPVPVVVITGFVDQEFGIAALSWGVSDYLLKDELSAYHLYKSISYSIERNRIANQLKKSEAKYHRLFHFSPLPMFVYELEKHSFLDVNEAAVTQYGFTRDEFLSMNLSVIWNAQNQEGDQVKSNQFEKFTVPSRGIVQHLKKNGELMFIEILSDAIEFDGKMAKLVVATDITEKTRAVKALQLSEQRFRALVQDGTDLIAIIGQEGNYQYVSPASRTVLGIPAEDLLGKKAMERIHEDDKERVQHHLDRLKEQKSIHIEPFRYRDAWNDWRWIETKLTNMIEDPSVGGIVVNSVDVTERLQSEMQIRDSIERYNVVSKATNDVIWDWNLSTHTIEWNENVRTLLGYEVRQTSEEWWVDRIHIEDRDRVMDHLSKTVQQGNSWSDEYRFRCADGGFKYFVDRGFVIKDLGGPGLRMIGSMHDITRQKQEEHRLKLLESVITNATDAVMIMEAIHVDRLALNIIYVNGAFTKMTGYAKEEVIGKSPRILQGPLTSKSELGKLQLSLQKGEPCEIEIVNYRKNGEKFWLSLAIAPVTDNRGRVTHFISIQRDITERRNYIQAIENQNEKLKEIAWTQSHVVRAPLARIMGLIEILPKYDSYEQIPKEVLQYILNSAHELDNIVRDIVLKTEDIYNTPQDEF
jgi:PAS domain S-box-containing protein